MSPDHIACIVLGVFSGGSLIIGTLVAAFPRKPRDKR